MLLSIMKYGGLVAALLVLSALPLCAAAVGTADPARQPVQPAVAGSGPPAIILATRPALLVTVSGPPRYTLVKGAEPLLWRVVNTGVLILKNAKGRHFLHFYNGFLEAESLNGAWRVAGKVPPAAWLAGKAARASGKTNLLEGKPDPRTGKKPSLGKSVLPWVYLATAPTELIVTAGTPDFISIPGTRLFYARNTAADLFWYQGDGVLYLLAAGHWYRAESYLGPWEIVPDDGVPQDFKEIPETSVKRRVTASLPPPRRPPVREVSESASGSAWFALLLAGHGILPTPSGFAPPAPLREWCERPR